MLVSLLLLVKPAKRNVQDSPKHCFRPTSCLACTKHFPNSSCSVWSPVFIHALPRCPLPAAGLPMTCSSRSAHPLPQRSPAFPSPLSLPLQSSPFPGSVFQEASSEKLLAGCPGLPRCQSLPLADHLSLCIIISCLFLCLPIDHTLGAGLSFSLTHFECLHV